MATFPLFDNSKIAGIGAVGSTSKGTVITAGTANAKGSWVALSTSTPNDADGLVILIGQNSASADYLVDIGIGAAGSETVIISNLCIGGKIPMVRTSSPIWPIPIPAGTRVSARCQSTTASATLTVQALLLQQGLMTSAPLARVNTYGDATADSGGTSVDPGATINTKGAWTQIAASTTNPHTGLVIGIGNQANTIRTTADILLDIGVGAAAAEQIIIPDFQVREDSTDDFMLPCQSHLFFATIPAGTALSARAQCSINDATDRLFDVVLYGVG
jgi:hypothetical protein